MGQRPILLQPGRHQHRPSQHRQRLQPAGDDQRDEQPGELQRRSERSGRQTDRRRTRSGEGEACRADERPTPQRSRRRSDQIGVRLRQQGQAAHRGDGEARRVQGRAVVPAKAGRRPAEARRRDAGADEGQFEKKPGEPTPEATKARPENKLEQPKAEPTKVEPDPEATKTTPEKKLERPKPEPTKPRRRGSSSSPSPNRRRSRREELEQPSRKRRGIRRRPRRRGKPEARCGHPGEPVCPK